MSGRLRRLLDPADLAMLCALGAVALSLRYFTPEQLPTGMALLAAFTVTALLHETVSRRAARLGHALLVLQPLLGLALVALAPRVGIAQVLLVIWTAVIAISWPPRVALAAVVLVNLACYALLRAAGHIAPGTMILLYAGFQGFAAMFAHYARTAERARDQLARVNADLLATRALLADSARDAERLRVARELHDVAGHKLTAMSLNLRALAGDPAFAARPEVAVSQRMASELLTDIRNVVHALRDARGLDLATALHALAAPLPRPRLELDIGDDVHIDDPALAETVLRLVQEALTNSARHGDATRVRVALRCDAGALAVTIDDDGHLHAPLREGHGMAGMRERVAERGGRLAFDRTAHGSLRIQAALPL